MYFSRNTCFVACHSPRRGSTFEWRSHAVNMVFVKIHFFSISSDTIPNSVNSKKDQLLWH